jgi:hypothetical protein
VSSSDEIAATEAELAQVASRTSADLTRLAQLLRSLFSEKVPAAQATQALARVRLPTGTSVAPGLLVAPPVVSGAFDNPTDALNYLIGLANIGTKDRPYDGHLFAVAAEALTNKGNSTDIGRPADFVMVLPSIDAQLEFDKSVEASTPVVSGGTLYRHPQRVRKIFHKASSATLAGTVSFWAYWWNS